MNLELERAKEIACERVLAEVEIAHNAFGVLMSFSSHAKRMNASRFKVLSWIQRFSLDAFILSICKLYEKPGKNYSIPTAIKHLKKNINDLCVDPCSANLLKLERFIQNKIDPDFNVTNVTSDRISGRDGMIRSMPLRIVNWFEKHCPQIRKCEDKKSDLDRIFDALRVLRDKRVAHHEENDLQKESKTTLDSALRLLAFAKTFENVVGYGFFGFSMDAEASPEDFAADKSTIWEPMQDMMTNLLNNSVDPT